MLVLAVSLVLTLVIAPLVSGFTERAARRDALVQSLQCRGAADPLACCP
jgi:type II secretory pathway pseudopilin PulG